MLSFGFRPFMSAFTPDHETELSHDIIRFERENMIEDLKGI